MVDVDRARIDALLHELRGVVPGEPFPTVEDLARRHALDPMIVKRIAEAEGFLLNNGDAVPSAIDPEADTGPVDV